MELNLFGDLDYPPNHVHQVWSNGGGTQSAAIAALIVMGKIEKPDFAIIADTGRELSSTWTYLEQWIRPALKSVGVEMVTAPRELASADLIWSTGTVLMPMFTNHSGKKSKLPTFCSGEWKRNVVRRQLRLLGVENCVQWLGFSVDESDRCKPTGVDWVTNRYPLIELGLSRADCVELVRGMGWGEPPRSRCYMCPHQTDDEWSEVKTNFPQEFNAAVALEQDLRAQDGTLFLHKSMLPISDVVFAGTSEPREICKAESCYT